MHTDAWTLKCKWVEARLEGVGEYLVGQHVFPPGARVCANSSYHRLERILALFLASSGFVSRLALFAFGRHAVRFEVCVGGAVAVRFWWDVLRGQNW